MIDRDCVGTGPDSDPHGNIFPIIKKAVYSGHEVFLRELVSNGVDAISKRRMAAMGGDCSEGEEGKIRISIDRDAKTITISDNGIGMTADEVKRYINQVAFSSAEEFLQKYKSENDAIIGHFGLGFYSSFMVANQVELVTLSARPESQAVRWSCDGSPNFTLEAGERSEPGTDVILHLQEEELEYIEPSRLRTLITTYCDFLPLEVQLEGETVNKRQAPWRSSPRDLTDQDYIDFYRYLYPFQGDPLLWVHLNTDYPYNLQGILFFPKITGRTDWERGDSPLLQPGVCQRLNQGGGAPLPAAPARRDRFPRHPPECEPQRPADRPARALDRWLRGQEGGRSPQGAPPR
jgi:molecular chaperone HtpG